MATAPAASVTKAEFTLDEFLSNIRQFNLARTNRFEVQINPPTALMAKWGAKLRRLAIMVSDAALPGRSNETARLRINGLSEQRARTIDFFGEAINFTFYVDDTWDIKQFVEDWHRLIINPTTREVGFYDNYKGTIEIRVFSVNDELRHSIVLEEAFPRSVQLMQVAQSSNQVQTHVVAFAFKKWTTKVWNYSVQPVQNTTPSATQNAIWDYLIHNINTIIQARPNSIPVSIIPGVDDLGAIEGILPQNLPIPFHV